MPDVAQHQEGESDYKPEKTYVDAFNLDLVYDVTDIYVPFGTEQLALEMRRSLRQETWSTNSLPMDKQYDKPFGPCWSSSICPSIHASYYHDQREGYAMLFEVTDHMGQTYAFRSNDQAGWAWTNTSLITKKYKFPESTQSALSLENVEFSYSTKTGGVLRLPNGTKIEYEGVDIYTLSEVDPDPDIGDAQEHIYARAKKATDRYGSELIYQYDLSDSTTNEPASRMIPTNITSSVGLGISITHSDGLVTSIKDPRGNTITYSYTNYTWVYTNQAYNANEDYSNHTNAMLVSVEREDGGTTQFTYQLSTEKDTNFNDYSGKYQYRADSQHWTVQSITDANDNSYSFGYTNALRYTLRYWANDDKLYNIGNPRVLTSITRPDDSLVEFTDTGELGSGVNSNNVTWIKSAKVPDGGRLNTVRDVNSNIWQYTFSDPVVCYPDKGTDSEVKLFEYGKLEISQLNASSNVVGREVYYSSRIKGEEMNDPYLDLHLMAAMTNINWSGQTNYFGYDYDDNAASNECAKPFFETNALEDVKYFGYTNQFGWQIASITNELGQITIFEFDAYGNRTNETKYASTSSATPISETWFVYDNPTNHSFMTEKIIRRHSTDPSWARDMVTVYAPHKYGKIAKEKVLYWDGIYVDLYLETEYDYDENNNLIYVKDPIGNVTTNGYDKLNRLTEIAFFEGTSALKCTKRFWYDKRSNKVWEKDEEGNMTHFSYDEFNNLVRTVRVMGWGYPNSTFDGWISSGNYDYSTNAADIVTYSEYNPDGTLAAAVDGLGLRTEFEYDALRRLTNSIVDPGTGNLNYKTSYSYGDNCGGLTLPPYKFMPTKVIDPRGYETETDYDVLSRIIETRAQVTNTTYAVTRNLYDALGNVLMVSNKVDNTPSWQITTNRYDGLNRLYMVENADGTETGIRYTSTGLQWQTTNELDRVTEVEYDLVGRPEKTKSPVLADSSQAVTETGYDDNGNVFWVKDANDNITTNFYDYRNRLVQTIAPEVYDYNGGSNAYPTVVTTYDKVGNVTSVTDAMGNTTTNFYDENNRMFATWAPQVAVYGGGNTRPTTTNTFDKAGNIIKTRDAKGKEVEMQYDILGRLTNTVDAVGNTISFKYDANGNQTHLTDGNANTTIFAYDGLNRKIKTTYPLVGDSSDYELAEYDLIGNRVERTDCNGAVTEYAYDNRNRLDLVTYSGSRTRHYKYDDAGNLTNVVESADSNADVSYTYDALNRVVTETSVGIEHEYAYDLNGNRTNVVYGVTDHEVEWEYDALNRITNIVENANETQYGYDLNSKPVYRKYPNGVEEERDFDAMGRLLAMCTTNLTGLGSFDMTYEYDAVGSARQMIQNSWNLSGQATNTTTSWEYDDRYRLTNETVEVTDSSSTVNTSTAYTWDSADNRLSKIVSVAGGSPVTTTYVNNNLNQMTKWTRGSTRGYYLYDANGNRRHKIIATSEGMNRTEYEYDEDNRLVATSEHTTDCLSNCANTLECAVCADLDGACPTGCAGQDPSCGTCAGDDICPTCQGTGFCHECDVEYASNWTPLGIEHEFKYDYRSRRYYRGTPDGSGGTNHMFSVFDGGLSIQEYEPASADLSENPLDAAGTSPNLRTEFIRGEGMGGGVGGMVYSVDTNDVIICSHANHRGDVIGRSDDDGSLTYFALYEAYGTRPYEWNDPVSGGDPDRQKANTKEEEKDLGLLNEGMRYRDLETGTFLTRDPIGYADGPNVYCYVHCNPITHFDAVGLRDYSYNGTLLIVEASLIDYVKAFTGAGPEITDGYLLYLVAPDGAAKILEGHKMNDAAAAMALLAAIDVVTDQSTDDQGGYATDSHGSQAGQEASELNQQSSTQQSTPGGQSAAEAQQESSETVTRYMGAGEAEEARITGNIPNYGADKQPRPTHLTTDPPVDSATEAEKRYELDPKPTHRTTVPKSRVSSFEPTPDGRPTTSGGGSQTATSDLIPVQKEEIVPLEDD
jgi:RHS repeat-associated protein